MEGYLKSENGITTISKEYKNTKKDIKIIMNDFLAENLQQAAVDQLVDVNLMENCIESIGLPDLHAGYGFPIGSVSVFENVICPLGVGYDINCGVRVVSTDIDKFSIDQETFGNKLDSIIPSGIYTEDNKSDFCLETSQLKDIAEKGLKYFNVDTDLIESNGFLEADPKLISQRALSRGLNNMGTLGSGNHYLEIQYVDEIYDEEAANIMGIKRKDQVLFMIHTGSRGFGHQICEDYIKGIDNKLGCFDINSEEGRKYMLAKGCAANFAFANRHVICEKVCDVFKSFYKAECNLIYDVCHNIGKKEFFEINGEMKELIIHRKGSSQALAPNDPKCPSKYKQIGQPVPIGGSMGTASYIVCGDNNSTKYTYSSTCHGSGRILSRSESLARYSKESVEQDLISKNIFVKCKTDRGLIEESPYSYKDIDNVIDSCEKTGISKKVVRLKPFIVVKG